MSGSEFAYAFHPIDGGLLVAALTPQGDPLLICDVCNLVHLAPERMGVEEAMWPGDADYPVLGPAPFAVAQEADLRRVGWYDRLPSPDLLPLLMWDPVADRHVLVHLPPAPLAVHADDYGPIAGVLSASGEVVLLCSRCRAVWGSLVAWKQARSVRPGDQGYPVLSWPPEDWVSAEALRACGWDDPVGTDGFTAEGGAPSLLPPITPPPA